MHVDHLISDIHEKILTLQNAVGKDYSEIEIENISRDLDSSINNLAQMAPTKIEDSFKIIKFLLSLIHAVFDDIEIAKHYAKIILSHIEHIEKNS